MSGAPLRTKVVFRGFVRHTLEPDDGRVKRVTLKSGVLAGEVESELVLRAALTDRRAVLISNPSIDGAELAIEIVGFSSSTPAPWTLASMIERTAWWSTTNPSSSNKIWFSHPRLFSDVMRFANRSRVVEWLEVEIDAALEKRLLPGRKVSTPVWSPSAAIRPAWAKARGMSA
jgi:hypothetical protein